MSEWFHAKVSYLRQMDSGLIKKITEQYLVDSCSFTECEARVISEQGEGVREVTVKAIARSDIKELVFYGDTDLWFKCKVTYNLMDEDSEKEKKVTTHLLVNANDAKEAYERTEEHLREMLVPFEIPSVQQSPIVDVYQYQQGLRPKHVDDKADDLKSEARTNARIQQFVNAGGIAIGTEGIISYRGVAKPLKFAEDATDSEWDEFMGLPEKTIDCAYTKKQQVGRSYDDEKPQHESPFYRGEEYEKGIQSIPDEKKREFLYGKPFPKTPQPHDISSNGLDSINKPPFGESPKPDPTDGKPVEFNANDISGILEVMGLGSMTIAQIERITKQAELPLNEFISWMMNAIGIGEQSSKMIWDFLNRE